LNEQEFRKHFSHCKPPRGFPKKFCKRCASNLPEMDRGAAEYHKNVCYHNEQWQGNEKERILSKPILIALSFDVWDGDVDWNAYDRIQN